VSRPTYFERGLEKTVGNILPVPQATSKTLGDFKGVTDFRQKVEEGIKKEKEWI